LCFEKPCPDIPCPAREGVAGGLGHDALEPLALRLFEISLAMGPSAPAEAEQAIIGQDGLQPLLAFGQGKRTHVLAVQGHQIEDAVAKIGGRAQCVLQQLKTGDAVLVERPRLQPVIPAKAGSHSPGRTARLYHFDFRRLRLPSKVCGPPAGLKFR